MEAGRELDALIAERVMGWRQTLFSNFPDQLEPPDEPGKARSVPHYSTDIAAAWLVVEKMRLTHWVEVLVYPELVFVRAGRLGDTHKVKVIRNEAATSPLAICLAALKALE
jgi:hypothetical protein